MSRYYRPWPTRVAPPPRGFARSVSRLALRAAAVAAPILRRFPGLVFTTALAALSLLAWVIARLSHNALQPDGWTIWPLQFSLVRDALGLTGVVVFVSLLAMFAIWWERKVAGFIQSRLGPMRVGGWHGWSQSLADGIKLLSKEDLVPTQADRVLFRLAPYLSFVPALCAYVVLPFGVSWVFRQIDVALLLVLAMLSLEILGILLAGWASGNKWSMLGAMRQTVQVVSYEVPMGIALLVPVMVAGTLALSGPDGITARQAGGWMHWFAFHSPWTFAAMFVYFVASLAACKRAPFDLPEAESELVGGFHTEYSGFRWSLFFFAEYSAMFVASGLLVLLFLGGWDAPWSGFAPAPAPAAGPLTGLARPLLFSSPLWFIVKCMLLIYVQMWLRWTLPRVRIDQVLHACLKYLLPMSIVILIAAAAWELAVERSPLFASVASVLQILLAVGGMLFCGAILAVIAGGRRLAQRLVGTMAVPAPLRGA